MAVADARAESEQEPPSAEHLRSSLQFLEELGPALQQKAEAAKKKYAEEMAAYEA